MCAELCENDREQAIKPQSKTFLTFTHKFGSVLLLLAYRHHNLPRLSTWICYMKRDVLLNRVLGVHPSYYCHVITIAS